MVGAMSLAVRAQRSAPGHPLAAISSASVSPTVPGSPSGSGQRK